MIRISDGIPVPKISSEFFTGLTAINPQGISTFTCVLKYVPVWGKIITHLTNSFPPPTGKFVQLTRLSLIDRTLFLEVRRLTSWEPTGSTFGYNAGSGTAPQFHSHTQRSAIKTVSWDYITTNVTLEVNVIYEVA